MRTILLIVNEKNRHSLVEKFSQVAAQFSNKRYRLRFAFLNSDHLSSRRWLNEIMFQKYRALENDNDLSDISDDDDYDDAIKAHLNKIDYANSLTCLAINQQRRHFLIFSVAAGSLDVKRESAVEGCLGFEGGSGRYDNKFQVELANWLDKLTEGLNMSDKFTVKKWPEFIWSEIWLL